MHGLLRTSKCWLVESHAWELRPARTRPSPALARSWYHLQAHHSTQWAMCLCILLLHSFGSPHLFGVASKHATKNHESVWLWQLVVPF
jgi:hypothetical protein